MFRIEFYNAGVPDGGWDHLGPLDVAKHAARLALKHREADFVRIVDVDGSGGEVWSERKADQAADTGASNGDEGTAAS